MKLAISIKGGVLQSIEADEPVGFVVYFYDDQLADVIGPGRPIFKSVEGNDCAIGNLRGRLDPRVTRVCGKTL